MKDGESVGGLAITVRTGAVLRIRVNDPRGLLAASRAAKNSEALSMGVTTRKGEFVTPRRISSDESGQDHYLIVPFEESLALAVKSSAHALSDRSHVRFVGDSRSIPIRIPSGAAAEPVVLNVENR